MNIKAGNVLLIGELTSEPIIEEIKILGKKYINKLLRSSANNWITGFYFNESNARLRNIPTYFEEIMDKNTFTTNLGYELKI